MRVCTHTCVGDACTQIVHVQTRSEMGLHMYGLIVCVCVCVCVCV